MRYMAERSQWEHTDEAERLHGMDNTAREDLPPSFRSVLDDYRKDRERAEAAHLREVDKVTNRDARIAELACEVTRLRQALEQAGATYKGSGRLGEIDYCGVCGDELKSCDSTPSEDNVKGGRWCGGYFARRALAPVTDETKERP